MQLFSKLINGTKLQQHWEKQLHTPERREPKERAEAWSVNNKYFMNVLFSQRSARRATIYTDCSKTTIRFGHLFSPAQAK